MSYPTLCLSILLSGVFILASAGKLRGRKAFAAFRGSVAELGGLRPVVARPVAVGLAAAEPVLAVLLLVPRTAAIGLAAAGCLLAVFTAYLIRALRADAQAPPCHCFGGSASPVAWRHVVRNLVLLGAVAADAVLAPWRGGSRLAPAGIVLCVVAAGVGVAAVAMLDDLAVLLRPARATQPAHLARVPAGRTR